jgi:hypothetical protein
VIKVNEPEAHCLLPQAFTDANNSMCAEASESFGEREHLALHAVCCLQAKTIEVIDSTWNTGKKGG